MSSARRSKKWPGPASPSRPCSMIRKNGSSAAKSARLAMGASTMPRLLLLRNGLGGEAGRRRADYSETAAGLGLAGHHDPDHPAASASVGLEAASHGGVYAPT